MSKSSREKIALVIFAMLIVLSVCAFVFYLAAGHSWNVAATTIDDAAGDMEGYSVIVYQGTASESDADSRQGTPTAKKEEDSVELLLSEEPGLKTTQGPKRVSAASVADEYRSKDASVLVLPSLDPSSFGEGMILRRGDSRFGMFGVDSSTKKKDVEAAVKYFAANSVDYVVFVVDDATHFERIGVFEGVDIVISSKDEGLFFMGETHDGVFYVDSPLKREVGVVLVSPSNVVSAKVVSA